jgi:hypothetical protein
MEYDLDFLTNDDLINDTDLHDYELIAQQSDNERE